MKGTYLSGASQLAARGYDQDPCCQRFCFSSKLRKVASLHVQRLANSRTASRADAPVDGGHVRPGDRQVPATLARPFSDAVGEPPITYQKGTRIDFAGLPYAPGTTVGTATRRMPDELATPCQPRISDSYCTPAGQGPLRS